ncbi:DUF6591 domain-containing protein [Clostridium minihomine]|uniref:DUF6591 domain-containing protein n=1 Tax=Clostridium minihomine TaxID=2045012 RepID=UPI000C7820A3|nr:DUF6591 domain-containing protein [Clostridium minihomine]
MNYKKLVLVLLLLFSLCACTNENVPSANSTSEVMEQLGVSYVETNKWPQNEWTEQLPQPQMGGIVRIGTHPESLSVHFMEVVPKDFENYIQALKDAGYTESFRAEEDIKSLHSMENPISVAVNLEKEKSLVQVVYTAKSGVIGIGEKQAETLD